MLSVPRTQEFPRIVINAIVFWASTLVTSDNDDAENTEQGKPSGKQDPYRFHPDVSCANITREKRYFRTVAQVYSIS